jgi:hypothetical protein
MFNSASKFKDCNIKLRKTLDDTINTSKEVSETLNLMELLDYSEIEIDRLLSHQEPTPDMVDLTTLKLNALKIGNK